MFKALKNIQVLGVMMVVVMSAMFSGAWAAGTPGTFKCALDPTDPNANPQLQAETNIPKSYNLTVSAAGSPSSSVAAAKALLNALPAGSRKIYLANDWRNRYAATVSNWLWNTSYTTCYTILNSWFTAYKAAGGLVDVVTADYEGSANSDIFWWVTDAASVTKCQQVEADSRFATDIKPLCDMYGWVKNPSGTYFAGSLHYDDNEMRYCNVQNEWVLLFLNRALFDAAIAQFPNVKAGNYWNARANSDYPVPDLYGNRAYKYSEGWSAGNTSQPVEYGWLYWSNRGKLPEGITSYPSTPFRGFLFCINWVRQCILSSPEIAVKPYIAWPTWDPTKSEEGTFQEGGVADINKTDYYREMMLHTCLHDPVMFDYWTVNGTTQADLHLTSNLLYEADDVAGYTDRISLVTDITPWLQQYALSGMYANGRNIWRITPDKSVVTRGAFKTADNPPTFKVGTTTITFPTGSAIYTPTTEYGPVGYWVTSPTGTGPSVNGTTVKLPKDAYGTITAGSCEKKSGVTVSGSSLSSIQNNAWACYKNLNFGKLTTASKLGMSVSSTTGNCSVDVWTDHWTGDIKTNLPARLGIASGQLGDKIATITVPNTQGATQTVAVTLNKTVGLRHHIYLVFTVASGASMTLNGFTFNDNQTVPVKGQGKADIQYLSPTLGQPRMERATGNVELALNLPVNSWIKFRIVNATGAVVRDVCSMNMKAGEHSLVWDQTSAGGNRSVTGVYLAQVKIHNTDIVKKIVLTR